MQFSWKRVRWGAGFGAGMLLLGFQAAIELGGAFWVTLAYTILCGSFCLGVAWINGTQAQKTAPFWMGVAATVLPLGYLVYAFPKEAQLILTLAWAVAVIIGLALAFKRVWQRSATQQPTS